MHRSRTVRHLALALLALIALAPAPLARAQAPARHTITHEDVWLMKRIGPPVVSPDGKWAVFSVTEPAYDDNNTVSDLWIVPTDGSAEPRRLTATKGGESGATWSPDGRRIAFSARREGDDVAQIYVLDVAAGGEAQRVTSISTGARGPQWKPDGRAILFTSDVYPGAATDSANRAAAAERRARKYNVRAFDGFPIRNWDRWMDDRRPHLFVQALEPGAAPQDLLALSQLAAGAGFGGGIGSGSDELPGRWTPDGAGVVFAATANRNEGAFADVVYSLWLVSATGGEPRRLTADGDDYRGAEFRPDGRALYALMSPNTEKTYNAARLAMWSWPEMDARTIVTGTFDRSVGVYDFSPDSRTVYFLAEDAGHVKLFRVSAAGGEVREVGQLTSGAFGGLSVSGAAAAPVVAATWESAVSPPEVVRVDAATGRTAPLSRFNVERASHIEWQPVREFWFTSNRGTRIHNLLVVPPAFDSTKHYPLFVVIHGGAANMWTDQFVLRWNYHLLGSPGYVVLLTNYTGSTGFGEKFAQAIQFDPLERPGNDVNEAADEAIRRFAFIDGTRQVAGGASYGGHLSNWLEATTTRYRAIVSHAGMVNVESQWGTSDFVYGREREMGGPHWGSDSIVARRWHQQNPIKRAAQMRTPILVSVGEHDFRVPMNNAIEFWSVLQRQRVPSRLLVFPDENHWIMRGEDSRYWYREAHAWLARWLGPEGAGPHG